MTSKNKKKVVVIVPAFNEASTVGGVVKSVLSNSRKKSYDLDVVVINDGSLDSTAAEAKKSGAIVIDHLLNSGAGSATATGLRYADMMGYDIAATMDADGQHSSLDLIKGVELINNSSTDLLIGSRLIDSSGMSKVKILGNKGLSFITFLLFRVNSTDSQSGLRIFSKNALGKIRWRTSGYEFCSEMLWRASQAKLKISEYPIQAIYTDYSLSKGQNNWNAFRIVSSLLRRRLVEVFSE